MGLPAIAVSALLTAGASPGVIPAACGNGRIDVQVERTCAPCIPGRPCKCGEVARPLEPCDGEDVGDKTCQTQGFFAGRLRCTSSCQLDTSGCERLASPLTLLHRTVGPAAERVAMAFETNVVGVLAQRGEQFTVTPYNWDLRGPWGKPFRAEGSGLALLPTASGWILVAAAGASSPPSIGVVSFGGELMPIERLDGSRLAGAVRRGPGGMVVATAREGDTRLATFDEAGKRVESTRDLPGALVAMIWHHGLVTLSRLGAGMSLTSSSEDPRKARTLPLPLVDAPATLAQVSEDTVALFYATAAGGFVRPVRLGDDPGVGPAVRLVPGRVRLVGAGYAGSVEGTFGVFDDEAGRVHVARLHGKERDVRTVFQRAGARALAVTSGYGHVFIAWNGDGQLHVTRLPAQFR